MSLWITSTSAARDNPRVLRNRSGLGAFTLIELLAVIAIVTVLSSLILSGVISAKQKAGSTRCKSNHRQFGLAFSLYAGDHDDAVLPNKDGQAVPLGETWVEGWAGIPGPDCTNVAFLKRSLLGPYITAAQVWQCPSSGLPIVNGVKMARVRTISLNSFVGGEPQSKASTYRKVADFAKRSASDIFTFVDERPETVNDASFALQRDFDEHSPFLWTLRDKPTVNHQLSATISFADGHVGHQLWVDARTHRPPRDDMILAGNLDILWLQQHGTTRP